MPISIRYPIVEAVTGLAALGAVLWLGLTIEAAAFFVLFALLLPSSLIDFEYQIIPNKITYPGIPLGIGLSVFRSDITWEESLVGVLIATGVLFGIRLFGKIIFKKEAMGLGDVKLIALIGAFVGDKKKFDKPVKVEIVPGSNVGVVGFITRDDMGAWGLPGQVAVYLPQSYNFAGNLIVIPRERVTPIDVPSGDVMAFVVSGGVTRQKAAANNGMENGSLKVNGNGTG